MTGFTGFRLWAALKNDMLTQSRNRLYVISIVFGLLVGLALAWLSRPQHDLVIVPSVLLMIAGGSTLLYVIGMIIFEKDQGTLQALVVSPLRPAEYLWAKVLSLSLLCLLECSLALLSLLWLHGRLHPAQWQSLPDLGLFLAGSLALGAFYSLVGIILVVRYDKITDCLMPIGAVATLLQLPVVYFLGISQHPGWLLLPSAPQTLLLRGAFVPLALWEWVYALTYSLLSVWLLSHWAQRAYAHHLIARGA